VSGGDTSLVVSLSTFSYRDREAVVGNRHTGPVRIAIRVRPGAGRVRVGGSHDGALVVRVAARPVEGQATEAALAAVAEAMGVRHRQVRLVSGPTSRTKVVEVDGGDPARLAALLGEAGLPDG
jgi:uncharacterized protein